MKRLSKVQLMGLLALSTGIVCLTLRFWLLLNGIDDKGLFIIQHPALRLLTILSVLIITGLLVLTCLSRYETTRLYFFTALPAAIGNWLAAIGLFIFSISNLLETSFPNTAAVILTILGSVSAVGLTYIGFCHIKERQPHILSNSILTVFFIALLLVWYPQWSTLPQLINCSFEVFALIFLLLASFYRSIMDTQQASWQMYLFFQTGAFFFCLPCLAGEKPLLYISMLIWLAANFPRNFKKNSEAGMTLPKAALYCIRMLEESGFEAYTVGGCVRDSLLGITPHDFDLCTSATPEEICIVFSDKKLIRNGEKHGTIGVIIKDEVYEITSFRAEGAYSDNRHPDWVTFVPDLETDLKRRDFTVNAIAYTPLEGYVDPLGGQEDLQNGILRAVGDPETRFKEDSLRILRGVRFAVRYHLTPEPETLQAMISLAPLMANLARERVFEELCKLLPLVTAQDLLDYAPIITQVIPELARCIGFDQRNVHHNYDIYTHTAQVVAAVPPDIILRWAALLHDIGKPDVFTLDESGQGHFYGHADVSAKKADAILQNLRAPTALREQVVFLISQHMTPPKPNKSYLLRRLGKYGKEALVRLLTLQKADFCGKGAGEETNLFTETESLLDSLLKQQPCLTTKDLAINGRNILKLGVVPGPIVGECMSYLLEQVQQGLILNTKEALLIAATNYLRQAANQTPQEDSQ